MILRKPYAFLIKHFRLIHFVLAILSFYTLYRTKLLLNFFNGYIMDMINITGQSLAPDLIPTLYRITPVLIIVITIILLTVMSFKNKPRMFYTLNILIYIFVIIATIVANSTFDTLYRSIMDAKTIRLVRDIVMMSYMTQFIVIPVIVIRTIGFDIKKFNFGQDLKDLEISEEDREEFELQFNFDGNELTRKVRRFKRFFRYSYKEHMLLYNSIVLLFIAAIGGAIGISYMMRPATVDQNVSITANGITMSIVDSYLVNTDYQGKIIDDENYYLLLRVKMKSTGTEVPLETATAKLTVGPYYYLHTLQRKDSFTDFGTVYKGEKISKNFEEKILVYQIPKKIINNEITFSYANIKASNSDKKINVRIKYENLLENHSHETYLMGQEIDFSNSILKDYHMLITQVDFSDIYKIQYNYCYSKQYCYPSTEYLKPTLNTNYPKILLRITGTLNKTKTVEGVHDIYDFIEHFGKICYNSSGVSKTYNLSANEIVSSRTPKANDYYIEVPSDIRDADSISIVFTIRDKIYEYTLK